MFLSFIDKLSLIFKNMFSSFFSVEIFIFFIALLLFLIFNIKENNKLTRYSLIALFAVFLISLLFVNHDYLLFSFDSIIKKIMNVFYFPSAIIYFLMILLSFILILVSSFSNKLSKTRKIVDASCFCIILLFFILFINNVVEGKIDIFNKVSLYTNNNVLSLVQVSNFIFLFWMMFIIFNKLFHYFKKKFD